MIPTLQTPPNQSARDAIGNAVREAVGGTLNAVRAELAAELDKAIVRRSEIRAELADNPGRAERLRLERRLADVEGEIGKLRSGIEQLDARGLTRPQGLLVPGTTTPPSLPPPPFQSNRDIPEEMIISIISIIFIGFPLALAFARLLWRRASGPTPAPPALPADTVRRFDHLEQAVDSIAIEVERISENQRYLTKILSEPRQNAAVSAGKDKLS